MTLPKWLSWIPFTKERRQRPKKDIESLRAEFKSRYYHFKLLLTANNKTLEIMSEMEDVLEKTPPLGMNFVRSRCTRVAANVFQIVKHLDAIAPQKYEGLFDRFKAIQSEINIYLAHPERRERHEIALPIDQINKEQEDQVGGKMANVGELANKLSLKVPSGFVLAARAYWRFVEHNHIQAEISEMIQSASAEMAGVDKLQALGDGIRQFVIGCPIPDDVKAAIEKQYQLLEELEGEGVSVVMRSSAIREDLPGMTFAGQYLSEFNVTRENIEHAYKKVIASKYSVEAITYRRSRGVRDDDVAMCVGCMPVVDCKAGGVAYSRNPLDVSDHNIMIHSVFGLPAPVADGSVVCDVFTVSRQEPMRVLKREIADKKEMYTYSPDERICRMEHISESGTKASLDDEQVIELAREVLLIEKHYSSPQDIEWALDRGGSLVFLQTRELIQKEPQQEESERPDFDRSVLAKRTETVLLEGGFTSSPGAGAGTVFVVKTERDVVDFPEGGILVAAQSLPYWAVVLNRTSAVVTEQGTAAGHLANVAREYHVPAIFGMEGATRKLEGGRLITVDADAKIVYDGRVEALLAKSRVSINPLQESPVYKVLSSAAEKIIPLRLIDPDSPKFKPNKCASLHDITRFCHEKAVKEMFHFGLDHKFRERSSRQLVVEVPMQFWIIDLEDGFVKETKHPKYIYLDEIVCRPMLALWRGMMTIAWKGPPPVSGRGFMGVLMGSASNPALNPSMPSAYAARNYFMISKNFCSLQSRFGYHFATVEALVGERSMENYVSFQFKGGAASLERRIRRTRLVMEVLEEQGFRTRQKQDNVSARMEGYDQAFMETKLEVLGYLMFHTRQLDMAMDNEASIKLYRKRIFEDLKTFQKDTSE